MKTTVTPGLCFMLFIAFSCTKEEVSNSSQSKINAENKIAAHYIGERFGGGVIFFLTPGGQHGLIADTLDVDGGSWHNFAGADILTGATDTSLGTGRSNTRLIIEKQGISGHYAALECAKSTRGGYTDWFLPSKQELNKLYIAKAIVGNFLPRHYWSSSEYDLYFAWSQGFGIGHRRHFSKDLGFSVRAIREF